MRDDEGEGTSLRRVARLRLRLGRTVCSVEHMTERQEEILNFILTHQREQGGIPPSTRDIQRHFKLSSQTTVVRALRSLAARGSLEQQANGAWGLRAKEVQAHLFELPIYGTISAGLPSWQDEQPKERFGFDPAVFGIKRPDRAWGLEVRGDSMIDAHILDGDIAVLERKEARAGEIVAALVDDTATTLKRLLKVGGRFVLHPENKRYRDIVPERHLEIQGVLLGVISRARR